MSSDRRAQTSRANLGDHIPEALDPQGSIVVAVRLKRSTVNEVDDRAAANGRTRSEQIRATIETNAQTLRERDEAERALAEMVEVIGRAEGYSGIATDFPVVIRVLSRAQKREEEDTL